MRAYYLTSEQWGLEAIKLRRLKLSLFNEMNDPFELLGVELRTKKDRTEFHQLKEDMNQSIGALCFSRNWDNPVLWSHYGDRHRGLCLGFDLLDWTFPIRYQGKRLTEEIEKKLSGKNHETMGNRILTTKYRHWRYEDEVRMIVQLVHAVHENNMYFLPFCKALRLREVIVGPRCDLGLQDLRRLVSPQDQGVRLTKSRLAFRAYKVIKNRASNQ